MEPMVASTVLRYGSDQADPMSSIGLKRDTSMTTISLPNATTLKRALYFCCETHSQPIPWIMMFWSLIFDVTVFDRPHRDELVPSATPGKPDCGPLGRPIHACLSKRAGSD